MVVTPSALAERREADCCVTLHYVVGHGIDARSKSACITARDTIDDKLAGLDTGADDYLVKPLEIRELEARIRTLLES